MLNKPCSSTENLLIPEAESYRGYWCNNDHCFEIENEGG